MYGTDQVRSRRVRKGWAWHANKGLTFWERNLELKTLKKINSVISESLLWLQLQCWISVHSNASGFQPKISKSHGSFFPSSLAVHRFLSIPTAVIETIARRKQSLGTQGLLSHISSQLEFLVDFGTIPCHHLVCWAALWMGAAIWTHQDCS